MDGNPMEATHYRVGLVPTVAAPHNVYSPRLDDVGTRAVDVSEGEIGISKSAIGYGVGLGPTDAVTSSCNIVCISGLRQISLTALVSV
jgi:hypothetical protein